MNFSLAGEVIGKITDFDKQNVQKQLTHSQSLENRLGSALQIIT